MLHAVKSSVFVCVSVAPEFEDLIICLVHPFTRSAFKPGRIFLFFPLFFYLLVVLVQPEAKGNPGCDFNGLPQGWTQVRFHAGGGFCRFRFFFFLALTHRGMFILCFLDQFHGHLINKKMLRPQFWIPAFYPLCRIYFSPCHSSVLSLSLLIMPLSNSPVAVLVCVQVSHPTDRWERCRYRWISSLTLALESTKSAWRVSFTYTYTWCVMSIQMYSNLQSIICHQGR